MYAGQEVLYFDQQKQMTNLATGLPGLPGLAGFPGLAGLHGLARLPGFAGFPGLASLPAYLHWFPKTSHRRRLTLIAYLPPGVPYFLDSELRSSHSASMMIWSDVFLLPASLLV